MTGTAILLEYALAPAAIAVFIGGYVDALIGIDGWVVYLASYAAFVGVHLWGAGEALKTMFVITALAVLALVVFAVGMLPCFDASNLFDVAVNEQALGASAFLAEGLVGVWAAFPFAIWLFLAVEGVPLAAEEAVDPARDMPRGIIVAMLALMVFGALVPVLARAGAGADFMKDHTAPLVGALQAVHGHDSLAATVVNWVGLSALIASFFSIIYAYSRQAFALSQRGLFAARAVDHECAQGAGAGIGRTWDIRLLTVAHRRRRPDPDHGGVRCDGVLRTDDAVAHDPAPDGAGTRASLSHTGWRVHIRGRFCAGDPGTDVDLPGKSGRRVLERRHLLGGDRLLPALQSLPPGGQCAGGGVRGDCARGTGA